MKWTSIQTLYENSDENSGEKYAIMNNNVMLNILIQRKRERGREREREREREGEREMKYT